ncbi:uncharacterized protein LOC129966191 [Argiope bruennichi]|uniref:uncharacterized protein LOC129966191 n=1 Tax=Argiope bruennichi TaxID=94029 RepID=UPI0024953DB9|nr:uncharacterized protein LOC129966191 [Argiope bruennichi]
MKEESHDQVVHTLDKMLKDVPEIITILANISQNGAAAEIVTIEETYASLKNALKERFDNKRLCVQSHFNDILTLEIHTSDSAKALRAFVDNCIKHVRALKIMGLEQNSFSESLLINILMKKLDRESRRQFELSLVSSNLPTWCEFIEFLEKRCLVLENIQGSITAKSKPQQESNKKSHSFFVGNNSKKVCVACNKPLHPLFKCEAFLKLNPVSRLNMIKNTHCTNCLSDSHKTNHCRSNNRCKICSGFHNSLLHVDSSIRNKKQQQQTSTNKSSDHQNTSDSNSNALAQTEISPSLCSQDRKTKNANSSILPTIIVYIKNAAGQKIPLRGICDTGSQNSFITTEVANKLALKKYKNNVTISGINGKTSQLHSKVLAEISNSDESYVTIAQLLVIPKITEYNLILLNLRFGFIDSSAKEGESEFNHKFCGLVTQNDNLEKIIERFWQVETLHENKFSLSEDSIYCEEHFKQTYKRNEVGRYIVEMPIKENPPVLGESKQIARNRLDSLITRLNKNPQMKKLYSEFIEEYEALGHMERVMEDELPETNYFLPHHGVYREGSTSTPLRVVFNASSPSSNGVSLNDLLCKGDVVEDIFELILRFRTHKFAFTFDIQKMFRQILVAPHQRDYLRILWFDENSHQEVTFRLKTVTYGISCAPHLAIRTIKQLALDEASNFPLASEMVLRDLYMDDGIRGAPDIQTAQILQQQLIKMFARP